MAAGGHFGFWLLTNSAAIFARVMGAKFFLNTSKSSNQVSNLTMLSVVTGPPDCTQLLVVIIGRWLLPSLVDTGDICCHYWQHILVIYLFINLFIYLLIIIIITLCSAAVNAPGNTTENTALTAAEPQPQPQPSAPDQPQPYPPGLPQPYPPYPPMGPPMGAMPNYGPYPPMGAAPTAPPPPGFTDVRNYQ